MGRSSDARSPGGADTGDVDEQRTTGAQGIAQLIELGRDREAAELAAHEQGVGTVGGKRGGPMDVLSQLDELGPLLAGTVGGITPVQLDAPTPCAALDVRGVLQHMVDGATTFTAAFGGTAPQIADRTDVLAAFVPALDALSGAIHRPGALDATVDGPFGSVGGETFARFVVLDGVVHGWDLATATGQRYEPSDALVADVRGFADGALTGMRGDAFAPPVEPPASATPIERLAAFTGRRV